MTIHHTSFAAPRSVLHTPPQHPIPHSSDILIIGAGVAGLMAALRAAAEAEVTLLAAGPLLVSNSARAQGGIAAALASHDSPAAHVADTLLAGAGLSDPAPVELLAQAAPAMMGELATLGVPFVRDAQGLALGLEGGHSQRRIVHVGDKTGWALTTTLIELASLHPRIRILEGYQAVDLLGDTLRCTGVLALDQAGGWHRFNAAATILATGGAGALYGLTSNHPGALGEGIALAYRAGAAIADLEFVQFHPTVLCTRAGQGFLISEAVRGEGAHLLTPGGQRFMPAYDPRAELAPRDVVARGIWAAMAREGSDHVLLDMTHLPASEIERHFPTIVAGCRAEGIDPAIMAIPVAPAAHYLMGGICTDLDGKTSLPGLFAAGECACTGVHGANRLASNSLLECLVFGRRAGAAALHYRRQPAPAAERYPSLEAAPQPLSILPPNWREQLALTMRSYAGVVRSASGLAQALAELASYPLQASPQAAAISAANAALVARLIVTSALLRAESRGGHYRLDHPASSAAWQVHLVLANRQPLATTPAVALLVRGGEASVGARP